MRAADIDDERLVHRPANFELLAETDRPAETLENAFAFLSGAGCRPAFYNFEREEPEKCDAREFQIEPQILCDLLNGPGTVELRRELCLGHSEPQILDPLESVARVSGNRSRVVVGSISELRELYETQGRERPLIDIQISAECVGEIGKRPLLIGKANARRGP